MQREGKKERRMRRGYSLRLALVVFVVAPLIIALGIVGLATERVLTTFAERRMQEEVELVASTIRLPLGRALAAGRGRDVERALRSAVRADPIYAVFVYDARGMPLATIGEEALPIDVDVISRVVVDGDTVGGYARLGERRVYSVAQPLRGSEGQRVGIVQVVRRRRDFDEAIAGLRRQIIAVLLFSCFAVSGLVLWGHDRAVGKALHRLEADIERMDKTGGGHRSEGGGPREVSRVSAALNAMLDRQDRDEAELGARRRKQQELEERLRHAEKLAAVGRLASGLAHELGTPLSVIDGHAQRQLRRTGDDGKLGRVMSAIRREVERMSAIVRQLLDFARRPKASPGTVRVDKAVEAAVAKVQGKPSGKEAKLEMISAEEDVLAHADAESVERIVLNLLDNAVFASKDGAVRVSLASREDGVGISVEDSGGGVPAEHRDRIFEPFFTTKAVGQGTGLGLAVVHGLLEEQGGSIEVHDSDLGGARFDVWLPCAKDGRETGESTA